jgi:hypothetical protein
MFAKQKALEQESRELAQHTARYTKQTKQWLQLVDDFNDALKVGPMTHMYGAQMITDALMD